MAYVKTNWVNDGAPAINAANLNKIEQGIYDAHVLANAPVKIASTIAGLGSGSDGQPGLLRIGAAPYEFVHLVFDATYGRWVSPEIPIQPFLGYWTNADGPGFELRAVFSGAGTQDLGFSWLRAKPYTDAGLRLELRAVGELSGTQANGFTTQLLVNVYEYALGVPGAASLGTVFGIDIGSPPSANSLFKPVDSGWQRMGAPATKDIWGVSVSLNSSTAQTIRWIGSVRGRWSGA